MPRKPTVSTLKNRPAKEISVMAWIENEAGKALLLKQKRGDGLWTFPGGKVCRGELLADALKREVFEETGLTVLSAEFADLFERPEKDNITFLFNATVEPGGVVTPCRREIEAARYRASLPDSVTPSLAYFWKRRRAKRPAKRFFA